MRPPPRPGLTRRPSLQRPGQAWSTPSRPPNRRRFSRQPATTARTPEATPTPSSTPTQRTPPLAALKTPRSTPRRYLPAISSHSSQFRARRLSLTSSLSTLWRDSRYRASTAINHGRRYNAHRLHRFHRRHSSRRSRRTCQPALATRRSRPTRCQPAPATRRSHRACRPAPSTRHSQVCRPTRRQPAPATRACQLTRCQPAPATRR